MELVVTENVHYEARQREQPPVAGSEESGAESHRCALDERRADLWGGL